jgi:hypothetical protein
VRWKCGNHRSLVISKDCGKRGKRLYVFLAFHQAGISTAPVFCTRNLSLVMCPRTPLHIQVNREKMRVWQEL